MNEPDSSTGNARVICALFRELAALDVEEYCVAAGARNAPLLVEVVRLEKKFYHFFDERSAAFFALGRCMMTRRPVAVFTTSGTAVAELFPAIMEAHYQALPLVAVTADRPSRYRGSGAPQAVEQPHLFGSYVSREVEMEAMPGEGLQITDHVKASHGPVHFNVCLEEGSSGLEDADEHTPLVKSGSVLAETASDSWEEFFETTGDLVVLVACLHPDDVSQVREFLLKLRAPIVAEATSNLQADSALAPYLLPGGEKTLAALKVTRVLRLGAVPSWRWWRDLEDREDIQVMSVSRAEFRGLARQTNVSVLPWACLFNSKFSIHHSKFTGAAAERTSRLSSLLDQHPHSEPAWMRLLSRRIDAGAVVMLGNSLPIREWNLAADQPKPGTCFFANRGANGIDGIVSTWLGLSAEAAESWLIVGDLSALYDLSAPWIISQLQEGRRRLVIINNGGGKIFSHVSWLTHLGEGTRQVLENTHELSFQPWAEMWGLSYRLITDLADIQDGDATAVIWEVRPDARQSEEFWEAWKKV